MKNANIKNKKGTKNKFKQKIIGKNENKKW
jgi:hypothetical protein